MEINMKKTILASILGLGMAANASADINGGQVLFLGSVSSVTCDIVVENESGQQDIEINLGTMPAGAGRSGTPVTFALTSRDGQACDLGTLTSASITFESTNLEGDYLMNRHGDAENVGVKLSYTGTATPVDITANRRTVSQALTGEPSVFRAPFRAQMVSVGTATAGTLSTSASFAVAFK